MTPTEAGAWYCARTLEILRQQEEMNRRVLRADPLDLSTFPAFPRTLEDLQSRFSTATLDECREAFLAAQNEWRRLCEVAYAELPDDEKRRRHYLAGLRTARDQ